ncbi:PHP-associated domain-containing protein [Chloroflexota bacterium]
MRQNELIKADFHIHTKYSMDCNTPLEKIITRCVELGMDCIAVSDHGTTEGALELQKMKPPFKVIVAEEILTPDGEIMGMFLKGTIPSGISSKEAIAQIKEQGGLVNIPHPFDTFRGFAVDGKELDSLVSDIDMVEVFNARGAYLKPLSRARAFARKYDLPGTAGSDAHTIGEIGNAHVEMPEFNDKEDFLEALRAGKVIGHRTTPLVHFLSAWEKLRTYLKG